MINNNQNNGSSGSDLKKLYSSHVLENRSLDKQKSDLDYAKVKKIQQLNNEERTFLRKYGNLSPGRPVSRASRARRGSIDVNIARAVELRYSQRPDTAEHAHKADHGTSLVKDLVNSGCPYSFDSWNVLTHEGILEKGKRSILFDERDNEANTEDSRPKNSDSYLIDNVKLANTLNLSARTSDIAKHNKVANNGIPTLNVNHSSEDNTSSDSEEMESSRLMRPKLKPISMRTDFDTDALDAEIVEIQGGNRPSFQTRRHSVSGLYLMERQRSFDHGRKLPSIRRGSVSERSYEAPTENKSDNSKKLVTDESPDKAPMVPRRGSLSTPGGRGILNRLRRKSIAAGEFTTYSPVTESPELAGNFEDNRSLIEKLRGTPKPVANATVVINCVSPTDTPQPANSTTMFSDDNNNTTIDPNVDAHGNVSVPDIKSLDLPRLPAINASNSVVSPRKSPGMARKHVSFQEDIVEELEIPDSRPTSSSLDVLKERKTKGKWTIATLKLLVDSHHGAAKLRYIDLLANEMQRENGLVPENSPEPSPMEQVSGCRYLRLPSKKFRDSE